MWRNPAIFTGTGHRIGATYHSAYWHDEYTVLSHGCHPGWVRVRRSDGQIVDHCTRLSWRDKRIDAVETNSMHLEDLQLSGW